MELDDPCFSDYNHCLRPTWFSLSRDFEDQRIQEAEAFNELLKQHLHASVEDWHCDDLGWIFELPSVTVRIFHDDAGPPYAKVESSILPRKYLDGLRSELRIMMCNPDELDISTFGFAGVLLRAVEEAVAWEEMFDRKLATYNGRRALHRADLERLRRKFPDDRGYDAQASEEYSNVMGDPHGVNLHSVNDTAAFLLGDSIENICSTIKRDYRILHVEPVFRNNLVSAFLNRKQQIHDELLSMPRGSLRASVSRTAIPRNSREDTKEGLAEYLSRPRVTFHGAPRRVIGSIVRYGFLVPGSRIGNSSQTLDVRCGSTYGRGIYSSPDATFASAYLDYESGMIQLSQPSEVPGMRLIVCAALMGQALTVSRDNAWRVEDVLDNYAHSHTSEDGLQYIVFASSQIVPCYVLHLDYGADSAKEDYEELCKDPNAYFQRRSKNRNENISRLHDDQSPGDVQRKKQALKAAATKWFPYGYGSAAGTSFVIEDMADHSDDEEEFGDFQYQRIVQDNEMRQEREARLANGGSWFDEYQTVRKSRKDIAT